MQSRRPASRITAKRSGLLPEARNPARSSPTRSAVRKELDQLLWLWPSRSSRKPARMVPAARDDSSVKWSQSADWAMTADDTDRPAQQKANRKARRRFISGLLVRVRWAKSARSPGPGALEISVEGRSKAGAGLAAVAVTVWIADRIPIGRRDLGRLGRPWWGRWRRPQVARAD